MKKLLLLFVSVIMSSSLFAQSSLSGSYNLPRPGDHLIKQQVVFKSPGPGGIQVLWDFSEQEPVNEDYELKYSSLLPSSDTIVGTEHQTMYYYHSRGDSLLLSGFENPTTLIQYRKPEALLVFPFPYGRTFTDYFDGKGNYCDRLSIHIQGKSIVTADGMGQIVLPGGDTLQHVLRLYTMKKIAERMNPISEPDTILFSDSIPFALNRDSIDHHLSNDSTHMEVETWRWYAEGFRYPVFETIKSTVYKFNDSYQHFETSFYYPPHEQYYDLTNDPENQEKRDIADEKRENKLFNSGDDEANGQATSNYHLDNQENLHIEYTVNDLANVTIALYDLQGRQLSDIRKTAQIEGRYKEILSLSHLPKGEYLLRIAINNDVYGEKIIK